MTSIEFYYMPESPPCRLVEMIASLVGVTLDKHYVNLHEKEHQTEAHLKINPFGKVPFIIDGELKINESRAIAAYIANRYLPQDNTLYPRDPVKRAQVDELLDIDLSTLYHSTSLMFYPILFGKAKNFDPEAEKTYRANWKYIDNRLKNGGHKFLLGENLTIADVSIINTLEFKGPFDYDLCEFKHLTEYAERVKTAVPKFQEINEEPLENFKKFIQVNQSKFDAQ